MYELIDRFMERPLGQRIAFWVGSLALIFYIFWQFFYANKHDDLAKLMEKIEGLNAQIIHERRLARNLTKIREEVKDLDSKLKYVMEQLPDKKEIPKLLASVSDLAMGAGLEVSLFKPKGESFRDFYAEVPVTVSVKGTFHQIATFFDEVGQLDRIVNIDQIALFEPQITDEAVQVKADCISTTFRYLEESERIQNESKKKGKRRRGGASNTKNTSAGASGE